MHPQDIHTLRQEMGVSQRKFAQILNVGHQTIRRWEHGITAPSEMHTALMEQLWQEVQRRKEKERRQQWVNSLLALAAGGAFGALLGKIFSDAAKEKEGTT